MTQVYCKEHPRVELIGGKCVACGEVTIKVKKEMSLLKQLAYLSGTVVILLVVVIFYNLIFNS